MAQVWNHGDGYRRGPPARIRFHGFESDTGRLQRAGWRMAEEVDDFHYDHSRMWTIILQSPGDQCMKLRGRCRQSRSEIIREDDMYAHYDGPLFFEVDEWFHEYKVSAHYQARYSARFREFDGSHTIDDRIVSVDWGSVFPPRQKAKDEVLVAKADMSVVDHLQRILELQAPKQKELRQKANGQQTELIAQLIQVA